MAKNNYDPNNYDQRQAEIRKAKGNPNKNVHQKKNGSNYKGYAAAKKEAEAAKAKSKVVRNQLPTWVSVPLVVIFVVLVGILVLMNTVMKESLIFGQIATIVIGVCCGILFYMRRYTKNPDSTFQNVLYIVLAVMSVVLIFMGGYGLLQALRA